MPTPTTTTRLSSTRITATQVRSFTNAGTFNIVAQATANAGSYAYAYAYMYTGIYQDVSLTVKATTASASITNAGTFEYSGQCERKWRNGRLCLRLHQRLRHLPVGGYGLHRRPRRLTIRAAQYRGERQCLAGSYAYAYASVSKGIYQEALGNNTTGGAASVALTNESTGTLNINAQAHATGGTDAYAYAYIDDYGIYQYAYDGETASAAITNAGEMTISASAHASAGSYAYADAYIDRWHLSRGLSVEQLRVLGSVDHE